MRLGNNGASITASVLESGIWMQTPFGALRVKLRHPDSVAYRRAVRDRRAEFDASKDDIEREDAVRRAIAVAAIVDLEGAVDVDGNVVAFSSETVAAIVDNVDNKPFVDWVSKEVIEIGSAADFEAVLKNSESVSLGS